MTQLMVDYDVCYKCKKWNCTSRQSTFGGCFDDPEVVMHRLEYCGGFEILEPTPAEKVETIKGYEDVFETAKTILPTRLSTPQDEIVPPLPEQTNEPIKSEPEWKEWEAFYKKHNG